MQYMAIIICRTFCTLRCLFFSVLCFEILTICDSVTWYIGISIVLIFTPINTSFKIGPSSNLKWIYVKKNSYINFTRFLACTQNNSRISQVFNSWALKFLVIFPIRTPLMYRHYCDSSRVNWSFPVYTKCYKKILEMNK